MKNKLLTALLGASLICGANQLKGQSKIQTIDVSEKVINFSSYCKSGKISIFEISEHGCQPCLACKEYLSDKNYDTNKVDIYYCLITKNNEDLKGHKYENRPSNKMWSYLEGCTMPPYVYIFGPTKNPVRIINGFSPEKMDETINTLLKSLNYYQEDLVDFKKK